MKQRGRKSSASLSIVTPADVVADARISPPSYLTAPQRDRFLSIVNEKRADWFDQASVDILAQYCVGLEKFERVQALLNQAETADHFDLAEYDKLLTMAERQMRACTSHATKLRLTPQSQHAARKIPNDPGGSAGKRPWE